MSRVERKLQKRFVVFCEGDTEYNYIDKMRKCQDVQIALKPVELMWHGNCWIAKAATWKNSSM